MFCAEKPSPPMGTDLGPEVGGGAQAPLPERAEKWLGVENRS